MSDNQIEDWQEAVSAMPDKFFFNTMRLYLGEIKTPYNKQRLISQLASFIRNPQNTKSILTLLDESDVKILTVIDLIPRVTLETLVDFFNGLYSYTQMYALILNLKERLVIYSKKEAYSDKEYLFINPLLKDALKPYLSIKLIMPSSIVESFSTQDIFTLSPNFLAAFVSYIKVQGISCKADGTIKKNDLNRLENIFPGKIKCIQYLLNAFINLSLVLEGPKAYGINFPRMNAFAKLEERVQYALLCAAAVSRFSKDGLRKESQLLLNCLSSIPETGFTRDNILRLAFLVSSSSSSSGSGTGARQSRFSQMLAAARSESSELPEQNAGLLDRMIDCAIEFGLLISAGKNYEDKDIYTVAAFENIAPAEAEPKVVSIDSTLSVNIMPGLSLAQLLPLTSFLNIKKIGVVTEFEITRKSMSAGFDKDWNPDLIFAEIEKYSYYELPQSLKINITEWYSAYASAMLYHGYVLKVSDTNITFAENNPKIKKYIKEKLAEGIYLLNIPVDEDISGFISESGLEFLGDVKGPAPVSEFTTFPMLEKGNPLKLVKEMPESTYTETQTSTTEALISDLRSVLEKMDLDKNFKESLEHRIAGRMILSEEQLRNASVRTEILEADGMDFNGKVHLIDAALKEEELMELQMPNANGDGKFFTLVGKPIGLSKQPGEAVVRFQLEPEKEIENILVSRITHLRRLRF